MPIVAATKESIAPAAEALVNGEMVAFPTETVYGLGANALDAAAVTKVFACKERPRFNPLIVHVLGLDQAQSYAAVNETARKLAERFWPGPLSLVLPRKRNCAIADLVTAGLNTVALRAPNHPVARALLETAKLPIAAPSANRSGRVSPTTAAHVEAELGELPAMILDGGPCKLGLESTVLGIEGDQVTLLRLGALSRQEIENVLGRKLAMHVAGGKVSSPGQLSIHYAPATPLRLEAHMPRGGEAFLAFGPHAPLYAGPMINLSEQGDLSEATNKFFAALRSLDAIGATAIAVMPIPNQGLGEAINDRLRRAAQARLSSPASRFDDARTTAPKRPSEATLDAMVRIVGEDHAIREPAAMAPYLVEWRDRYVGRAALVLKPASAAEVAAILKRANETRTDIVPQGGNTGLVGGQIPFESGHEVVVSLSRMTHVRDIDLSGNTMTVEAGLVLANAQAVAASAGRLFPLSLASEGSCQIGGVLATNAGGTAVLAYGSARDLTLGLEVVLADGRVWNGLKRLRKDNSGYDLKDLFIGSEGTLGIITAAVLRLLPKPAEIATAFAGLSHLESAAAFFTRAYALAGPMLTAFELLPRIGLDFVLKHGAATRDPLHSAHPWYVLFELSSQRDDGEVARLAEMLLSEGIEAKEIDDAVIAASLAQRRELWRLRELMSEVQKHEGGSIKHDVAVPVARMPEFIARANQLVELMIPGARPVPFGHLGDGNIHYNVSQPPSMDRAVFLANWEALNAAVHEIVLDLDGSISAEHGIGRLKRDLLRHAKQPLELEMMRKIKNAFDPYGILNPGKLL